MLTIFPLFLLSILQTYPKSPSNTEELFKLKTLLDENIINQEEF